MQITMCIYIYVYIYDMYIYIYDVYIYMICIYRYMICIYIDIDGMYIYILYICISTGKCSSIFHSTVINNQQVTCKSMRFKHQNQSVVLTREQWRTTEHLDLYNYLPVQIPWCKHNQLYWGHWPEIMGINMVWWYMEHPPFVNVDQLLRRPMLFSQVSISLLIYSSLSPMSQPIHVVSYHPNTGKRPGPHSDMSFSQQPYQQPDTS